jgi:hypothetical protein
VTQARLAELASSSAWAGYQISDFETGRAEITDVVFARLLWAIAGAIPDQDRQQRFWEWLVPLLEQPVLVPC